MSRRKLRTRSPRVVLVSEDGRRRSLSRRQSALALLAHTRATLTGSSLTDALEALTAEVENLTAEVVSDGG